MTELNVLALALVMRAFCFIAAVAGAAYLAYNDKAGWGWMIFLAVIVASTSYKYTPDTGN